jgi:hypothetical protein
MKHFVTIRHLHARHQSILAIVTRGIANHALLLAQLLLEKHRILPVKRNSFGLGHCLGLPVECDHILSATADISSQIAHAAGILKQLIKFSLTSVNKL